MNTYIQTQSGQRVFPLAPETSPISLDDIAHALSRICRFTGHVQGFLSVAEHCVHVSRRAEELAKELSPVENDLMDYTLMVARWGLLHDASEAYLADLASPVKRQDAMEPYRVAEKRLQDAIMRRFDLPLDMPPEVHQADLELLATEARDCMGVADPKNDPIWQTQYAPLRDVKVIGYEPWSGRATAMFWARARKLGIK